MLTKPVQLRKSLMVDASAISLETAQRMGFSNPHIELVAITSALKLDMQHKPSQLGEEVVVALIDAIESHFECRDQLTPAAREDVREKVIDATLVLLIWLTKNKELEKAWDRFARLAQNADLEVGAPRQRKQMGLYGIARAVTSRPASRDALRYF